MLNSVVFYVVALIILVSAFRMVYAKNLIHSILFMVATFLGIAFLYVLLHADYLVVVQILVYVGAVSVLFVFGVMLTRRDSMDVSNPFNRYTAAAALVMFLFLIILGRIILLTSFTPSSAAPPDSTVRPIVALILNDYSIAFEASGLLLLVAMIGAIVIGKGVNSKK